LIQKLLFSLLVEKMDDNYIYFELKNRKLKINKEDSENIWVWRELKTRNSYWYKLKLRDDNKGYYRFSINKTYYRHHRVVYYAWNQDWDINHEPRNNHIDHIHHDTHNNHISNLRVGTSSLNQQNRMTKYVKGYSWSKKDKKYRAKIVINYKQISLGSYEKEEDARKAYLDAKKIYHKW